MSSCDNDITPLKPIECSPEIETSVLLRRMKMLKDTWIKNVMNVFDMDRREAEAYFCKIFPNGYIV